MSNSGQNTRTGQGKLLEAQAEDANKKTPDQSLFSYKGVLYPCSVTSKETLQALQLLEAREDDLLIVTYPKSGTNWVCQVLHEVVHLTHQREPLVDALILEFGKPEKVEHLKEKPSPRILSTHLNYDNMPRSFFEKKSKILLILRNPKDTAVSFYHFYNNNPVLPTYSSWDLFFKDYISGNVCYGSYFEYLLGWNKKLDELNIMTVTFEEMKEDFAVQLEKICEFTGLPLTKEQIKLVEKKTTFKSMKEKATETNSKLAKAMFRKGEIGDWKSNFTEEQSQEVDSKFEASLAGTTLGEKLNYNKYCKF
ncbi:sulfotransferase 6B1-like [Spea bombifrons]|uniref:sulfotransferase 6B1-like n=1 Tax=Spea bombifrons TaxID=233779 RepID=UPI00234ABEB0|nr:sulfotransferase 6B1-like [Spea bombifrons]